MKTCFKCGETKELSCFYKHPAMADGHVNKCKECNKKDVKQNRSDKEAYYSQYDKMRYRRDEYRQQQLLSLRELIPKDQVREIKRKSAKKYAHRQQAKNMFQRMVHDKGLAKDTCEICSSQLNVEGHHFDYNRPLDVVWLCAKCHKGVHSWFDTVLIDRYKAIVKATFNVDATSPYLDVES